jgi:hypothetical protein
MGTFTASLRSIGDIRGLPATVELSEDGLRIEAAEMEIGSWALSEVRLDPTATGYRMTVEGEEILLEFKDPDAFGQALEERNSKKSRLPSMRKRSGSKRKDERPAASVDVATSPSRDSRPQRKEQRSGSRTADGRSGGFGSRVDALLGRAHKQFGGFLPDWVFSRGVLAIGTVVLIAMLALPGLASILLLIAGIVVVLVGAVAYSDSVIASRILPGRMTAAHVLITGVGILVAGILFGLVSNWLG